MYGFVVILIFKMEMINNFLMVEFTSLLYDTTFGRNSVSTFRCLHMMYLHDNQICFKGIFHDKLSQPQVPICFIIHSQQFSFCNGHCWKTETITMSTVHSKLEKWHTAEFLGSYSLYSRALYPDESKYKSLVSSFTAYLLLEQGSK